MGAIRVFSDSSDPSARKLTEKLLQDGLIVERIDLSQDTDAASQLEILTGSTDQPYVMLTDGRVIPAATYSQVLSALEKM